MQPPLIWDQLIQYLYSMVSPISQLCHLYLSTSISGSFQIQSGQAHLWWLDLRSSILSWPFCLWFCFPIGSRFWNVWLRLWRNCFNRSNQPLRSVQLHPLLWQLLSYLPIGLQWQSHAYRPFRHKQPSCLLVKSQHTLYLSWLVPSISSPDFLP